MGPLSKKPSKLDLVIVMALFIALEMSEGRVMYGQRMGTGWDRTGQNRMGTGRSNQKILEVTKSPGLHD